MCIENFLHKQLKGSLHMKISDDKISNVKTHSMVQIDEPVISWGV